MSSRILLLKAQVKGHTRRAGGKLVYVQPYSTMRRTSMAGQPSLFDHQKFAPPAAQRADPEVERLAAALHKWAEREGFPGIADELRTARAAGTLTKEALAAIGNRARDLLLARGLEQLNDHLQARREVEMATSPREGS